MIVTLENFTEAHAKLMGHELLAVDTETTGLGEEDRAFAAIAHTGHDTFYIDSRIIGADATGALLHKAASRRLIFQNAKFDLKMLYNTWGLDFSDREILDIEVLGRLVRNDHFSYSLDSASNRECPEDTKSDAVLKYLKANRLQRHEFSKVPIEIMGPYAETDARVTWKIKHSLLPKLDSRSLDVWEMEKKLVPVCFWMERAGVQIDVEYTLKAKEYEEGLIREAKSQFLLATGQLYDNKKTSLVEVFLKAGETIPKTQKGNDSLTDDILESFTSPAAKIVQKIRFHEKRISTYYSSFLELKDSKGVIHADMRQAGTTTGRFSYRDPNLQNVPKEENSTDPFVVRGCIVPRPGNIFISMDYKQQEYRLMLAYAKHRRLIKAVMAGADVHQATAEVVGITRKQAKTLNFAILYGAGPEKIAQMLGISIAEASRLREKYFSSLLEVEDLIARIISKGRVCGHVFTWFGRKLFINRRDFAYKLPNHVIQGGGADICKLAMLECARLLRGIAPGMVLQIHDAIVFELPKDVDPKLIFDLKKAMIDVFPTKNGMAMDVDITWSDKSLAERDLKPYEGNCSFH